MKLKNLGLFLVLVLFALVLIVCLEINIDGKKLYLNQKKLPEFYFETLQGKPFTQDSIIDINREFAICHFEPDCHYCIDFAKSISKLSTNQLRLPLIMVSSSNVESVLNFSKIYGLHKFPSMTFLVDPKHQFYQYFGKGVVPMTYLYKNAQLIDVYKGELDLELLINP